MDGKFIRMKRLAIPFITVMLIAAQLMGCSSVSGNEFTKFAASDSAIEIVIETPEAVEEQGTEREFEWVQLDQLSSYPEFRRAFDDALGVTSYTEVDGTASKNGMIYADLEGNHTGNSTLSYAFANNRFRQDYWENEDMQKKVQEAVLEQYADVEEKTTEAKVAAINAYYNLLDDADPNYFNGECFVTRLEFMEALYKAETPVHDLGESDLADSALGVLEAESYLKGADLNENTVNGTMTIGEAVYLLMNHYYSTEMGAVDSKAALEDVKNAGDLPVKSNYEGDYGRSYELAYTLQNVDKGAPEYIWKALVVAKDKEVFTESTRWNEGLTKTEALDLIINAMNSKPSVHSVQQGKGEGIVVKEAGEGLDGVALEENPVSVAAEIFDDEDEAVNQQNVEEGNVDTFVELDIEEMDGYLFAQVNVALREKPTVESKKLKTVTSGTRVHVTGMTSDGMWYRVDDSDNGSGFISGSYLGVSKPAAPAEEQVEEKSEVETPAAETTAPPVETPAPPAETQQPAPAETQQSAPVVNPGDEDLPSLEELTGKPITSDYDLNSIPNTDTATSAEEYAEQIEHGTGFGGILHAG